MEKNCFGDCWGRDGNCAPVSPLTLCFTLNIPQKEEEFHIFSKLSKHYSKVIVSFKGFKNKLCNTSKENVFTLSKMHPFQKTGTQPLQQC